jgi:hypothetical protein
VKIPFLVLGTIAFATLRGRRFAGAAALAAASCAIAYALVAGPPFVHAFAHYLTQRRTGQGPAAGVLSAGFALGAAAVYVAAFVRRRGSAPAAWIVPAAVPTMFAWYLVWLLPYAVFTRERLATTLVSLPLAAVALDFAYDLGPLPAIVAVTLASVCGYAAARERRRPGRAEPATRTPGEPRYG